MKWNITTHVEKLEHLINHAQELKCQHNYGEENFVEDSLSKLNHKITTYEKNSTVSCYHQKIEHITNQMSMLLPS